MLILYTFVFSAYYQTSIRQIATRLSEDETRRTYLNSAYRCVTWIPIEEGAKISENIFLYELDVYPEDMSNSI